MYIYIAKFCKRARTHTHTHTLDCVGASCVLKRACACVGWRGVFGAVGGGVHSHIMRVHPLPPPPLPFPPTHANQETILLHDTVLQQLGGVPSRGVFDAPAKPPDAHVPKRSGLPVVYLRPNGHCSSDHHATCLPPSLQAGSLNPKLYTLKPYTLHPTPYILNARMRARACMCYTHTHLCRGTCSVRGHGSVMYVCVHVCMYAGTGLINLLFLLQNYRR